jgi:hypothetical protein
MFKIDDNDATRQPKNGIKNVNAKLNVVELAKMRELYKDLMILILDEISFTSGHALWNLHCRLCEIFNTTLDIPFGGKAVVLMGDFLQLPPVLGKSLIKQAFARERDLQHDVNPKTDNSDKGVLLFQKFLMVKFARQMRSTDPDQTKLLQDFRNNPRQPVSDSLIKMFMSRVASPADFVRDKAWQDATIVVELNSTRECINLAMLKMFALKRGLPVITWRLAFRGQADLHCNDEERAAIYDNNLCLIGMYVEGSPVYLNENLNALKGLANGTYGLQKSLVFDEPHKQEEFDRIMAEKKWVPGELLQIDYAPIAVMHAFPSVPRNAFDEAGCLGDLCSDDHDQEPADVHGAAFDDMAAMRVHAEESNDDSDLACLVIPVPNAKNAKTVTIGRGSARMDWYYTHTGYEHAFAVTYYKGTIEISS